LFSALAFSFPALAFAFLFAASVLALVSLAWPSFSTFPKFLYSSGSSTSLEVLT